jgi:D-alanyl-D-alanine carboxypeptidase
MRYKMILLFSITIVFLTCQSPVKVSPLIYSCENIPNTLTDSAAIKKLEQLLQKLYDLGAVGTAMMVESDKGVWSGSIGMADIPNDVKVQPCHEFRIGSISKIFIVTAALRLCMQNKLSLDDKMSEYVDKEYSDNIANGNIVTIRQLMNHTSKIPEYMTTEYNMGDFNYAHNRLSAREKLKLIYGKPPMKEFGYSNSNALLLGMVIAAIEKKNAYDVIKEQVITPLGLNNTFVGNDEPAGLIRAYANYYGNGKIIDVTDIDNRAIGGQDNTDGGIISNVSDLVTFIQALNDTTFIDMNTHVEMMQKIWFTPTMSLSYYDGYSLGLTHLNTKYGYAVGHWGDIFGFHGMVFNFPDKNLSLAILTNTYSEAVPYMVSNEIFDYFF